MSDSCLHELPQSPDAGSEYTDRHIKSGYSVLHTAIDQNDVALLSNLLNKKKVDLNVQNIYDETPLMMSIRRNDPTSTIMQLIKAGCDFNIADYTGKTPLHMAIYHENLDIAHELIKRGANIDACSSDGNSSLFYAIISRNVEIIYMLLYYGVDVSIQNKEGLTAFTYAMQYSRNGCACEDCRSLVSLLIPYYDDFSYTDNNDYSVLYIAIDFHDDLAFQLLDVGADVNGIINHDGECGAFKYGMSADLLKRILPKLDYNILLKTHTPFLYTYLQYVFSPISDWLEYLYLILEWPIASDLLQHLQYDGLSYKLMSTLYKWEIESNHRTNIISICLALGAEVGITELNNAIKLFGFKEEFEMLIYAASNFTKFEYRTSIIHPLLLFILGKEDFNKKIAIKLMKKQMETWYRTRYRIWLIRTIEGKVSRFESGIIENSIINSLNFFSIPNTTKQKLIKVCQAQSDINKYQWVVDKINDVPEFPSLFELSRNEAHKLIRRTHKIKRPYDFMDAVKHLELPQLMKDVILFKKPIY